MWVRNNKDLPVFFTKSKTSKGISAKRTPVIMLKLIAIVDTQTKKNIPLKSLYLSTSLFKSTLTRSSSNRPTGSKNKNDKNTFGCEVVQSGHVLGSVSANHFFAHGTQADREQKSVRADTPISMRGSDWVTWRVDRLWGMTGKDSLVAREPAAREGSANESMQFLVYSVSTGSLLTQFSDNNTLA